VQAKVHSSNNQNAPITISSANFDRLFQYLIQISAGTDFGQNSKWQSFLTKNNILPLDHHADC
jgi:hypothetical protein